MSDVSCLPIWEATADMLSDAAPRPPPETPKDQVSFQNPVKAWRRSQ